MLSSQLSSVQEQVVASLAAGASISEAAAQAGVHRNTIGNWRRSAPTFRTALAHALYDRAMLVREQTEALAGTAIDTLREILTSAQASPSVRLKAALAILQQASTPLPEPPIQWNVLPPDEVPLEVVHNPAQTAPSTYFRIEPRIGRNEPCLCGSGRKFKYCCLNKTKPSGTLHQSVTN